MKNILGHDSDSEIKTIIARLREKRFTKISENDFSIVFTINLKFYFSAPISNNYQQKIKFQIEKEENKFKLQQFNGIDNREITFSDGYTIWNILKDE